MTALRRRIALGAILAIGTSFRLMHLTAPLADSLQAKQVYVANKARSIARSPLNPLRDSLDFLDASGVRTRLTEEVPVYPALLAFGYRIVGERDWVGHLLSVLGTTLALLAFFDLVRREWDDRSALRATALLSSCPLLMFYGRAVLPDPWMLAGMVGSAACYRRYLDTSKFRWFLAAAACGSAAALFKYFGLMILIPLAEMTRRRGGSWRALLSGRFAALCAALIAPVAAWMGVVFLRTANPLRSGWIDGQVYPYLVIQAPEVLCSRVFWGALLGRFPLRDCGPIAALLMVVGVFVAARRRLDLPASRLSMLGSWSVMGLAFFFLLAPKLRDHDYYEIMLLPAVALWGALGMQALGKRAPEVASVLLGLAILLQSPWAAPGFFRQDVGKLALSEALLSACPIGSRVVAIGPGIEFPTVVHYSQREGWPIHSRVLPHDWQARMERYRDLGASCVGVYFEPKATAEERRSYRDLIDALPVIEHRSGLETRSGAGGEFFVLDLRRPQLARKDR